MLPCACAPACRAPRGWPATSYLPRLAQSCPLPGTTRHLPGRRDEDCPPAATCVCTPRLECAAGCVCARVMSYSVWGMHRRYSVVHCNCLGVWRAADNVCGAAVCCIAVRLPSDAVRCVALACSGMHWHTMCWRVLPWPPAALRLCCCVPYGGALCAGGAAKHSCSGVPCIVVCGLVLQRGANAVQPQ